MYTEASESSVELGVTSAWDKEERMAEKRVLLPPRFSRMVPNAQVSKLLSFCSRHRLEHINAKLVYGSAVKGSSSMLKALSSMPV